MAVEIISRSISTKVWDRAEIELVILGYAVKLASVARHVCSKPLDKGAEKVLTRSCGYPGLSGPLLFAHAISTNIFMHFQITYAFQ